MWVHLPMSVHMVSTGWCLASSSIAVTLSSETGPLLELGVPGQWAAGVLLLLAPIPCWAYTYIMHNQLVCGCWGSEPRSSWLCKKHSTHWSYSYKPNFWNSLQWGTWCHKTKDTADGSFFPTQSCGHSVPNKHTFINYKLLIINCMAYCTGLLLTSSYNIN